MSSDPSSVSEWVHRYEAHLDGGGTQTPDAFLDGEAEHVDLLEALRMVAGLRTGAAVPGERFGTYRIERELGRGAQGRVYLAEDTRLGRHVALKVLTPASVEVGEFFLRFKREAEAAGRVSHPNLCTVYEAGVQDGHPFIAMQLVDGPTLTHSIADASTTSDRLADRIELIEQVAHGLEAVHQAGLVHRDIKPGNILLRSGGHPVLTDFGLARMDEGEFASLTHTGDLRGTPAYMAPEQVRGASAVDARTDVYALGVVAYELFTGKRPYEGATWNALFSRILHAEPERPPRMPSDLWVVLQTALEKDPQRRYATASDFAEDLRRARTHEPVRARPAGTITRARRWVRRRPAVALALLLTLGGAVALAVQQNLAARDLEAGKRAADEARDRADRRAYLANIQAADASLANHDAAEARRRLADCPEALRGWEWDYLSTALDESIGSVEADPGGVKRLAISADGALLLSGGDDGRGRLWAAGDLQAAAVLEHAPSGPVFGVAFSRDGQTVATGGYDHSIVLWRTDGELVARLERHNDRLMCLAFTPDGSRLVSGGRGDVVCVHDLETGELAHRLERQGGEIRDVVAGPGRVAYFGTGLGHVTVLDVDAGSTKRLAKFDAQVWDLAISSDGTLLLAGLSDGTARLLDATTGRERIVFRGHARRVTGVSFVDDNRVATASLDGAVRIWNMQTGALEEVLVGHTGSVRALVWNTSTRELLTGGDDGSLRRWVIAPSPARMRSTDGEGTAAGISFHPDGRSLAVGGRRGWLFVHDAWSGDILRILRGHRGSVRDVTHSADGRFLASASNDGTVRVWDTLTFEPFRVLRGAGSLYALAVSPDGSELAAGGTEGAVRTWDLGTGRATAIYDKTRFDVVDLAYGPAGKTIAVARSSGISIMEVPSGREVLHLPVDSRRIAYAPDGSHIAASRGPQAYVYSVPDGRLVQELEGHEGFIYELAYHPAGRRLATASYDQTVRLWDTIDGSTVSVLRDCTSRTQVVAWSVDGSALAATSSDRSLQLWRSRRPAGFSAAMKSRAEGLRRARSLAAALARDARSTPDAVEALLRRDDLLEPTRRAALHLLQQFSARDLDSVLQPALWRLVGKEEPTASERGEIEENAYRLAALQSRGALAGRVLALARFRTGDARAALDLIRAYEQDRAQRGAVSDDPVAALIRTLALVGVGDVDQARDMLADAEKRLAGWRWKTAAWVGSLAAEARHAVQSASR